MISITVAILPGGYAEIRRIIGLVHLANLSDLARRNDRWMRSSNQQVRLPEERRRLAPFTCAAVTAPLGDVLCGG